MDGKRFLITGATGLIGYALVRHIVDSISDAHVILPIRNMEKAKAMFGEAGNISLYECDLLTTDFEFARDVDYIIHCAAPTASSFFVEHPLETYNSIFMPTQHLLEYATRHKIEGFVYLSSLEVYGITNQEEGKMVYEEELGYIDMNSPRSSYPLAKRSAEHLCFLYASQHGVPISIARLTQTTGRGVALDDNRVINAFCRSAALGKDIVLLTSGESARPYCHIADAIDAIMLLLEKGKKGEAYNVANEESYISAYDLALRIKEVLNPSIEVRIEMKKDVPFPPASFLPLSTAKLQALGWKPKHGLEDILKDVYKMFKGVRG